MTTKFRTWRPDPFSLCIEAFVKGGPAPRWLVASLAAHGALWLALALCPLPAALPPVSVPTSFVEFSFAPPPEAPPTPAPPPPAPTPMPTAPESLAALALRPHVTSLRGPVPRPLPSSTPAPPEPLPAAPPPPPPPPVLHAADLLRAGDAVALAMSADAPARPLSVAPSGGRDLFPGSTGTAAERLQEASAGYVREALAATTTREAPGVRGYLWNVRRRVSESWRPGVVRVPNLTETLLAGFIAPERAVRIFGDRMIRRQQQAIEPVAPRLSGGAADAIESIGGVAGSGPSGRQSLPANAGDESWRRNVRTTRAEVEVEQDESGRVLHVRLLHSSGITGFDNAAQEAVRQGIEEQDPVNLPGGRRSRWSFTVVATRRLITPSVGGQFDESRGWFRLEVPGQVTLRSRVQMESSAPRTPSPP